MFPDQHVRIAPRLSGAWPFVLSPAKLWVLAMLAPKAGLRVAPVPPQAANLTAPARMAAQCPGRDGGQVL